MAPKVLFVDDEEAMLAMIRRQMLLRGAAEARFTAKGEVALAFLEAEPFDVVVADLHMPDMDGADLLAEVARLQPGAARLILSGGYDPSDMVRYALIAHQIILKPVTVDNLLATVDALARLKEVVTNPALAEMVGRMRSLPVVPEVYLRLQKLLSSETVSLEDVGEVIALDPGLTTTILRLCNSAFFGQGREITSPVQAVRLLGTEIIKALALFGGLFRTLSPVEAAAAELSNVWRHSLRTAGCARNIALAARGGVKFSEQCFLAGLLHDIGKILFMDNFPEEYGKIQVWARERQASLHRLEREEFGVCHAEIGAYLMGLWALSPEVTQAVAFHHDLAGSGEPALDILAVLHAADVLEREISGGQGEDDRFDEGYLAAAGCLEHLDEWRRICRENLGEEQTEDQNGGET
ncbi:metal dependent phosphohydrolase [Desulfovibrio sp. X2]|uniref:response regulator n=1 Tax=Desulfovibrio sp. X2 TaxID=941449 RepID=UPI0003587A56|nr:response regulator [Desulfovibrio sp. X2]EPR43794.1 metal dependent phosphohydrolase [Desulfovibrio sp. X2]